MGLNVKRCDLFPVGTVVHAYGGITIERTRGHKPSGTEAASATVDALGNLSFPTLGEGRWELWAEVGGVEVNLMAGSENFTPNAGPNLVCPNAITFNSGLLNKRGAVTAGVPPPSVGMPSGAGITTSGGGISSGVIPAPLAERIQALRAFTGCAPNSLAPLI